MYFDLFAYIGSGIIYMKGGVDSGFEHVDADDVVKRLFKIKGKINVQVTQV